MATGKIKRKLIVLLTCVICVTGVQSLNARDCCHANGVVCHELTDNQQRQFDFVISDVIYKSDDNLTRVCGNLIGRPHTAARIDGVTLKSAGAVIKANDIDGVDFERYFQWEDDGNIYIEIDFPGYRQSRRMLGCSDGSQIVFHTAKGDVVVPVATRKDALKK